MKLKINVINSPLRLAKCVPQSGQKRFMKNVVPIFPLVSQVNKSIKRDSRVCTLQNQNSDSMSTCLTPEKFYSSFQSASGTPPPPVLIQPSSNPPVNSHKKFELVYKLIKITAKYESMIR